MLVWITSHGAEHQAVRNENHGWKSSEADNRQHKKRDEVEVEVGKEKEKEEEKKKQK